MEAVRVHGFRVPLSSLNLGNAREVSFSRLGPRGARTRSAKGRRYPADQVEIWAKACSPRQGHLGSADRLLQVHTRHECGQGKAAGA
jgi:hypothetical protein